MAQLFGREYSRRELEAFGSLEQYAGISRIKGVDGFEQNVDLIEVRTGGGLRFTVAPSRGLDIVQAEFGGTNLAWRHPNGVIHPSYYGDDNFDWSRGGPCGLLTTCGLSSFGPACEDEGEHYSLHDRYSYLPAREVSARTNWRDDHTCEFELRGTIRQTRLFGVNLRLERTITAQLGSNRIKVSDQISNDGFVPAPVVVLYHCNFGFPLLAPGARVEIEQLKVVPRNDDAARGLEKWHRFEPPTAGPPEEVFFHALDRQQIQTRAAIINDELGLAVSLHFSPQELPYFTQWKTEASGAYALGLEPSNARLVSRAELRERGELPYFAAGETRKFEIELEVARTR